MTIYRNHTELLLTRELERLKKEYIYLTLDDLKPSVKEDIILLEKAMDVLSKNKIQVIEEAYIPL